MGGGGGGGGLANADLIRGGGVAQCWQLLSGGRGGKICQNLADVICERSLSGLWASTGARGAATPIFGPIVAQYE